MYNLATPFLSTYRIDVISTPKFFTKLQFQVSDPPLSPGGDQLKGFWRPVEMESGCLLDDSQQREITLVVLADYLDKKNKNWFHAQPHRIT